MTRLQPWHPAALLGWGLLPVCLWACAASHGSKPPARAPEPVPTVADLFTGGTGSGAHLMDTELADPAALADFLGETGAGLLACGATGAARARYLPDAGSETPVVAVLVEFADADHARCGHDVDRPAKPSVLRTGLPDLDERMLPTALGTRQVESGVRGRVVLRVLPPLDGTALNASRRLAWVLWQSLPEQPTSSPEKVLPATGLVPGSARVVTADQAPFPGARGLAVTALYDCGTAEPAVAYAVVTEHEESAAGLRREFQLDAASQKRSPAALMLGTVPAVTTLDPVTLNQSILIQNGATLFVLTRFLHRSACAPVMKAMAYVPPPPDPPDAGQPPPPDAGAEPVDGGTAAEQSDAGTPDGAAPPDKP